MWQRGRDMRQGTVSGTCQKRTSMSFFLTPPPIVLFLSTRIVCTQQPGGKERLDKRKSSDLPKLISSTNGNWRRLASAKESVKRNCANSRNMNMIVGDLARRRRIGWRSGERL